MIFKTRNIFRCIVITLVVLLLLVSLLIPWLLNIWIVPTIGQQLGLQYTATNIWLNPISGTLTIDKGMLKQQQSPLFKWKKLSVDLDLLALLSKQVVIQQIALEEPSFWLRRNKQGKWNIESLKPSKSSVAKKNDDKSIDFTLKNISINNGTAFYHAFKNNKSVSYKIDKLDFSMQDLSSDFTKPFKTKLELTAVDKGFLSWQGDIKLSPLTVEGSTSVSEINIQKVVSLIPITLPVKLKQGILSEFKTELKLKKKENNIAVELEKIFIGLDTLQVIPVNTDYASFKLENFTLTNGLFRWPDNQLNLGNWKLNKLDWQGKLDQQKQLNWLAAFQTKPSVANSQSIKDNEEKTENVKPWEVSWQQGMISSSQLNLKDASLQPVVDHKLHLDAMKLASWNSQQNNPLIVTTNGKLAAGGQFNLSGEIGLNPIMVKGKANINNINVGHYQGYWQPFFSAGLEGNITSNLQVAWNPNDKDIPYQVAGDFKWNDWLLQKLDDGEVIGSGRQFTIKGISLLPNKINISALSLDNPDISVERKLNQQWNFSSLLPVKANNNTTMDKAEQVDEQGWKWFIDSLTVKKGKLGFKDSTVTPVAEFNLNQISGNMKKLSSEEKKSNLQLSALIADSGINIEGELIPLNPRKLASVKFTVNNMSLPMFSSYATKYLGYPVERGKLGATLYYNMKDFNLQSDNKVTFNKLKLGKKTKSKEAVDAPVKLALALLEDRAGKIALDVPVQGNFKKPDVKYGQLVVDAVMKLFAGIAASPFNLLSDLVSFSGEDVNLIKFKPGYSELVDSEQKKLAAIYSLLDKRPNLILEVQGQYDRVQDKQAIANKLLVSQLEADIGNEANISPQQKKQWLIAQLNKANIITNDSMSVELLNRLLIDKTVVTDNKLISLAKGRSSAIVEYIAKQGKIKQTRIYKLKAKPVTNTLKDEISTILTINTP